jgi:hypothetical protein
MSRALGGRVNAMDVYMGGIVPGEVVIYYVSRTVGMMFSVVYILT